MASICKSNNRIGLDGLSELIILIQYFEDKSTSIKTECHSVPRYRQKLGTLRNTKEYWWGTVRNPEWKPKELWGTMKPQGILKNTKTLKTLWNYKKPNEFITIVKGPKDHLRKKYWLQELPWFRRQLKIYLPKIECTSMPPEFSLVNIILWNIFFECE